MRLARLFSGLFATPSSPPETRSLLEISSISSSHDEDSGILAIVLPVVKITVVENHAVISNVFFRLIPGGINADNVAAAQR